MNGKGRECLMETTLLVRQGGRLVLTECHRQLELFEVGHQVATVDFERGDGRQQPDVVPHVFRAIREDRLVSRGHLLEQTFEPPATRR